MSKQESELLPKIIKGYNPLFFNQEILFASKGNKVYSFSESLKKVEEIGIYSEGIIRNILSLHPLYCRIFRRGIHALALNENGNLVGVAKGHIVFKNKKEKVFHSVFNKFRGSRPFNLIYANGMFLFGEYFGNPNRENVCIFSSADGEHWNTIYTFPPGSIRHIHSIKYDANKKGYWILTGDNDNESVIWFTEDFKTLNPVIKGGQFARAVNIITTKNFLIIPMDSPLEQNYIQFYNLEKGILETVSEIPGSAFHAIESDGIMLVSTVTEPSQINKTNSATLWGSLDGKVWKCICELKKDIYPVSLQPIFRYAEIVLTPGENYTPYITAFGRSLKGMDNCMLIWNKSELKDFLSN